VVADPLVGRLVVDPLIGQVLEGRYQVASRVARGGMATVYVARDLKLGREVAVKVMHSEVARDEEFVARFIGEAKIAAGLAHPNVVAVYDQGTSGEHVFLVMEYVPGRTLRDLLNERGRLGPRHALSLLRPVLAALGAAHRAGLVHRDVKPENVLLTDDGRVKVADFGLARAQAASKQTKTGLIIGTVAYMAPEQVVSGTADARSDVYSAGILLFELVTGRQPYLAESPLAVAYKHVNEVVPLPSGVLPGVPPALDALVAAATAVDPRRRPADADHFAAAVAEVERTLPADIDHRLAQAAPPEPHNATAILQVPPGLLGRSAQVSDESPVLNRILSAFTGRFVLVGIGLIALLVLGSAAWYQTAGQYQSTPSVIGLSVTDATAELKAKGYTVFQGPARFSDKIVKGGVTATDPPPGGRISQGGVITVFPSKGLQGGAITVPPSKGLQGVPIPDLKGMSLSRAQAALQALGLTFVSATEPSAGIPSGQVTRTVPPAGRTAQPGADTIIIYVSSRRGPNRLPVPSVVGQTQEQARQTLQVAGFKVTINEQDPANGQQNDIILAQNPPAGSLAAAGTMITLLATKHGGGGHGHGHGGGGNGG
jgi:eukaryotic-like serine/threonine-protein kinase